MRATRRTAVLPTGVRAAVAALALSGPAPGAAWAATAAGPARPAPVPAPATPTPDPYEALRYRFIGPPGNRVSAVAGVPGDPNTYYAGGASGGVWKSTDGGTHWAPVFDDQPAQSIGSIAIAPSDPNVVWVGTGESFIRSNVSLGNGVYRSTDAGKTWKHLGLEKTGRVGRIAVDPRNPDVAFAAALGTCYGPQPERGVYRTTDGGKTWERVLFVDEKTGVSDLAMDPSNPRVLFAGTWQIEIKTWGRKSGGPGSGVFVSRDGGTTWKRIVGHGLPDPPLGKIAVAVAPSDPQRVYALIETGERGSLWRSTDGGEEWKPVNHSRLLNERPHYYTRMLVMPDDANEVYFPCNSMGVTYDGGETADLVPWGGDNHDMWADPRNPARMMIGSDVGVHVSTTRGKRWTTWRLPVAQVYHAATDDRIPYRVYGQMQDDGSFRIPSQNPGGWGIPPALVTSTAGCETGWSTPDPVNPDVVWGGCYAGVLERFDARTGMTRTVSVWPERTMGANAGEIKLRMNWTFPIAISPHDHETVYVGSQFVHATHDGGQTWTAISPDLTRNDRTMMGDSGGLTVDNLSVEYAGVVFSIAESPLEKGLIWAGTNDGLVQVTRDGGAHWTNVTAALTGLPPNGTVGSVDPSRHAAGTCTVSVDLHQVDDRNPWIYRTTDYGRTWTSIGAGIPRSPLSYVKVVRESPHRKGLLFAGTENALYVSFDEGKRWEPLQSKLPHAPVSWLTVQERFHDLVVSTYGRGFYVLDDLTPLEQLTDAVRAEPVHLFAPREAYRFRPVSQPNLAPGGTSRGKNPPYGASLGYWLAKPLPEPVKDATKDGEDGEDAGKTPAVTVTIRDAQGAVVRVIEGTNKAGVNRVTWDLRGAPAPDVRLRTTPAGNRHLWEEKRFRGKVSRGVFYYGIDDPKRGPLVAPGTYTVTLSAGGAEQKQTLVVRKDPNSPGTDADVAASTRFGQALHRDVGRTVGMINRLEWTRRQLEETRRMTKAAKADAAVLATVDALDARLRAVEDRLLQPTLAEADIKSFRGPMGLYLQLLWLLAESGTGGGDVSGNADLPPTGPEIEVYTLLSTRLAQVSAEIDALYAKEIPAFNLSIAAAGYGTLATFVELEVPKPAKPEEEGGDDDE